MSELSVVPFTLGIFSEITFSLIGMYLRGYWTFLPFIYTFVGLTFFEFIFGNKVWNPNEEESKNLKNNKKFKILMEFYVVFHALYFIGHFYWIKKAEPNWFEILGFVLSNGTVFGGIGFVVGHELMHKLTSLEILMSKFCCSIVWYGHFVISHVHVHHKKIGTFEDPNTSRLNENV
jgi:alkane 1-monooxygenase